MWRRGCIGLVLLIVAAFFFFICTSDWDKQNKQLSVPVVGAHPHPELKAL